MNPRGEDKHRRGDVEKSVQAEQHNAVEQDCGTGFLRHQQVLACLVIAAHGTHPLGGSCRIYAI